MPLQLLALNCWSIFGHSSHNHCQKGQETAKQIVVEGPFGCVDASQLVERKLRQWASEKHPRLHHLQSMSHVIATTNPTLLFSVHIHATAVSSQE